MITKKDVEYVAKLARLNLNEEEKEKYMVQLNQILQYMEKLNQLDTSKVEPTFNIVGLENVWRADEVRPSAGPEVILANAPQEEAGYFKVKKVMD